MASESERPEDTRAWPRLRVDIDAVTIWEPVGHVREGKSPGKVVGLSVQSWDFRPPKGAQGKVDPCELVVVENQQECRLPDGSTLLVGKTREWTLEGRYVETRDFPAPDGSPRPKHFFEATLPPDLDERLRESPEDIMAKSDLYDGKLPPPKGR